MAFAATHTFPQSDSTTRFWLYSSLSSFDSGIFLLLLFMSLSLFFVPRCRSFSNPSSSMDCSLWSSPVFASTSLLVSEPDRDASSVASSFSVLVCFGVSIVSVSPASSSDARVTPNFNSSSTAIFSSSPLSSEVYSFTTPLSSLISRPFSATASS